MKGKIIIESIPDKLGGGFTAYHNSAKLVSGDGESPLEALRDFIIHYGGNHLTTAAPDTKDYPKCTCYPHNLFDHGCQCR